MNKPRSGSDLALVLQELGRIRAHQAYQDSWFEWIDHQLEAILAGCVAPAIDPTQLLAKRTELAAKRQRLLAALSAAPTVPPTTQETPS